MKKHPILTSILFTVPLAILLVVVLKLVGYDDPTEIIVGIVAGVTGVIRSSQVKKKNEEQLELNKQS